MATDLLGLFDPLSEPTVDEDPLSSSNDEMSIVEIDSEPPVTNGYQYSSEEDSQESVLANHQEELMINGETTPTNPESIVVEGSRDVEEDATVQEPPWAQQTPASDHDSESQSAPKKIPLAVQFNSLPIVYDRNPEADEKEEARSSATTDIIRSDRGSVYGWANQVTKSKSAFLGKVAETKLSPRMKKVVEEEGPNEELGIKGKIVIYITSLSAVRDTYSKSCAVLEVFHNHLVRYKTKDTYLHPKYKKELKERLNERKVTIPQVFINGKYVGDDKKILEMNESGQLLSRIVGFEKADMDEVCPTCSDRGFIMCMWCKGSKKGWKNRFGSLECTVCNKNALQKCPDCSDIYKKVKKSSSTSEEKQEA